MNWDAIGAIGEVVGALAVVLTLGYLAIQIRLSSKSSRQQSYHDLVTGRSDYYNKMVESDDVTSILMAGWSGESMNAIEGQRFTSSLLNRVRVELNISVRDVAPQWSGS